MLEQHGYTQSDSDLSNVNCRLCCNQKLYSHD